jgi:RNA polymerase sigma-70 factor (ECF subfamily)
MLPSENPYTQNQLQIEEDLVQINAAKLDLSNFSGLYDKYYNPVFRFIYQRVESTELAAEVCSQTFLKAMSCLSQYKDKGLPFASWLYTIARNEVNMLYRKQKSERNFYLNLTEEHELTADIAEEEPVNPETLLKPLLESLKPEDLELLEMRYFEKRSFNEIALITNISETNAKVRVHRILAKLREKACQTRQFEIGLFVIFMSNIIFAV